MAGRTGRPVERQLAFWDASALVPLCVRQSFTGRMTSLYRKYLVVVWWGTPIEIASAMARLVRIQQMDVSDWTKSRKVAKALADGWLTIQPSAHLLGIAIQLVERYDLRAGDALQLAAALEWCGGLATGNVFLATDRRLREAAALSGFEVPRIDAAGL